MKFRVRVTYANGDDFTQPHQSSDVEVEATHANEARLIGEQMAYIPHRGKYEHIQIVKTQMRQQQVGRVVRT